MNTIKHSLLFAGIFGMACILSSAGQIPVPGNTPLDGDRIDLRSLLPKIDLRDLYQRLDELVTAFEKGGEPSPAQPVRVDEQLAATFQSKQATGSSSGWELSIPVASNSWRTTYPRPPAERPR